MIIKINGETSLNKLPKIVKEVVADITTRAGIDGADFKVKDVELGLIFKVGGEMNYLSVEHDGMAEIFQVNVQLDSNGDIDKSIDNEEHSFVDDYTRAVTQGLDSPVTEPIESAYNSENLIQIAEQNAGDLQEVVYVVKGSDERVLRYFRHGILVGETGYRSK